MSPPMEFAWLRGFALALLGSLSMLACGTDSVVGGDCRAGLSECSLRCVDLANDRNNCGACGRRCAGNLACVAGVCGGDGGAVDAGNEAAAGGDASIGDGSSGERPLDDAPGAGGGDEGGDGSGVPGDGASTDGPVCAPPFDTSEHCGTCATQCSNPTPLCALEAGEFRCASICQAPLELCGGHCVNTFSDEDNCGSCGLVCPSGICQGGMCVGKGYGHEVVIGMDYTDPTLSQTSAPITMLGNAIFQSGRSTVRVLSYEESADPANVTRVEGWLTAAAAARGRGVSFVQSGDWMGVPEELTIINYEVFLVLDQALAPADRMATAGTFWNGAMNGFAKGGGIIVALDGGSQGRMRDLLTNGGLLPISDETDVTGTQIRVDAPTDVVGLNLPNVFAAKKSTVAFTTTQVADNLHVFVVKDQTGKLPIVVHSVPLP